VIDWATKAAGVATCVSYAVDLHAECERDLRDSEQISTTSSRVEPANAQLSLSLERSCSRFQ
jgi:hypothetical protein